jgi:hypothetical protein
MIPATRLADPFYLAPLAPAEVLAREGRQWRILLGDRLVLADLAPSCLLEPEAGDLVVALSLGEGAHILAIAQLPAQAAPTDRVLTLPPGVTINGEVADLRLADLRLTANNLQARTGRASWSGAWLKLDFSLFEVLARSLVSVLGRLWRRCQSLRSDSRRAALSAERLTLNAEKSFEAQAGSLNLTARSIIKIDGKVINLG